MEQTCCSTWTDVASIQVFYVDWRMQTHSFITQESHFFLSNMHKKINTQAVAYSISISELLPAHLELTNGIRLLYIL